jgi:hypothetical protein
VSNPLLPPSPPNPEGAPAGAYSARVPLLRAAAVQAAAGVIVGILVLLLPAAGAGRGETMAWALAQGIVAARLGRGLGMEAWWLPIHLLFVPGLVWTLGLSLPPHYALIAFCLLASTFWGVSRTRVPLYLSSRAVAEAVAAALPQERSFSFVDLGCGLGGMLSYLARARPAGRYSGIEAAPVPFLLSRLRAALGGRAVRIDWGDLNALDLGRYDVVYAYLSPAAMDGLWHKASREMRPGSLLISNGFAVPGVTPTLTLAAGAQGGARLLLWRM